MIGMIAVIVFITFFASLAHIASIATIAYLANRIWDQQWVWVQEIACMQAPTGYINK